MIIPVRKTHLFFFPNLAIKKKMIEIIKQLINPALLLIAFANAVSKICAIANPGKWKSTLRLVNIEFAIEKIPIIQKK